jgi:hypothetical protein
MTNWSELSLFVGAVTASIASLVIAIQKSKCSVIDCACVHCERNVGDPEQQGGVVSDEATVAAARDRPIHVVELEENLRRV